MIRSLPRDLAAAVALACLQAFTLAAARSAQADTDPFAGMTTLERESLVHAVLERNPSIEAARTAWRAAAAMPAQERALDDPMIGYAFAPQSVGVSDLEYGQVIELGQKLPFPGKRGIRALVAQAEARAAEGDYESMRRDIALMASMLFDEYYAASRAVEVNKRHGELLKEMLASAKASYAAGRIPQHSLVRVELQLAHVLHDAAEVHSDTDSAQAAINALLRRPPTAPLPPPPARITPSDLAFVEEMGAVSTDLQRPEIIAARARVDAADSAVRLARREYFPDFTVGGEYNTMWEDDEHRLMVGVQMEIPLQLGRRKAALAAAEAGAKSRRAELASLEDNVAAEIQMARRRYEKAEHITALYRDNLLPAAQDVISSARAGLAASTVEFGELIDAEHELRTIELEYEMSIADLARRRAELERSLGRIPGVKP
ncbi:MAG TPA: TolC family protein [Candidatus Binatia bacterium]|nr:TolC family protein [Candidatus Binatia bacterium]